MRNEGEQRSYVVGYQRGVVAALVAIQHNTYDEARDRLEKRIDFIVDNCPGATRTVRLPEADAV